MPTKPLLLTCLLTTACTFGGEAAAQQQDSSGQFIQRDSTPRTGSLFRDVLVTSELPLDKPYEELTADQKQIVRSWYEALHPLDEPPYPTKGLGPLYAALQKGATAYQARGDLFVVVGINSMGKTTSAELLKSPDPDFGKFAMQAALLTAFKPGQCRGEPCLMEFPIRMKFSLR